MSDDTLFPMPPEEPVSYTPLLDEQDPTHLVIDPYQKALFDEAAPKQRTTRIDLVTPRCAIKTALDLRRPRTQKENTP